MSSRLHLVLAGCLVALASSGCNGDDSEPTEPASDCPPGGTTLTAQNFGQEFFQDYCTRCHSSTLMGPARNGAPPEANFDTLAGIRAELEEIDARAGADGTEVHTSMPPGPPTPTDAERLQLSEWLACGAP